MGSEPECDFAELTPGALAADEGVSGMRQAVDHFVEVISKSAGKIDPFNFHRQRGLLEEFFVMAQGVMVRGKAAGTGFICSLFGSGFQFHQGPDGFANCDEASSRFEGNPVCENRRVCG
jgi:hypothetical protein